MPEGDRAALAGLTHLGDELADFQDTAAVVALCDLVITVDTSVAHLAGAMGRPLWVLLPFWPDWRWTLDRERSPWYPDARLFRQGADGDWEPVIARVAELDIADAMFGRTTPSASLPLFHSASMRLRNARGRSANSRPGDALRGFRVRGAARVDQRRRAASATARARRAAP